LVERKKKALRRPGVRPEIFELFSLRGLPEGRMGLQGKI